VALVAETVRVEDAPALIVAGLATMLAVGPAAGVTVTVTVEEDDPPPLVALAV
jgi:hypothetical protein